ncbi:hypothetical protein HN51_034356 [Arachis hypogaea]
MYGQDCQKLPNDAWDYHGALKLSLSSPLRHCAVASQLLAVVAISWRHHLVPLLLAVAAHLPSAVGPSLLSRTTPRPRCSVAQLLALAAQLAQLRFTKGSIAQWLFSSKVSAVPHLMSFKVSQDEKPFDSTLKFPAPEQVSHYLPSLSLSLNSSEIDKSELSLMFFRPQCLVFSISNQAISVSVENP